MLLFFIYTDLYRLVNYIDSIVKLKSAWLVYKNWWQGWMFI